MEERARAKARAGDMEIWSGALDRQLCCHSIISYNDNIIVCSQILICTLIKNTYIYIFISLQSPTHQVVAVSRVSGFLRILEEVLMQIHALAVEDAVFQKPDSEVCGCVGGL